jgi:GDP/UDP-N,N'-diacetylbacillosamine 2-epimerase (hydrolysing)
MNDAHKERLLKMGEEPWRVYSTGNPALDRFKEIENMDKEEVLKYFEFNQAEDLGKPLIMVLQHVISGEVKNAKVDIEQTLVAVTQTECNCIVNYPNSDMGSREIISVIEKYRKLPNVRISRNIPRKEFVNLLRNIDLLVGNSSMALLEGSFLKIPAINVGERNRNRMNGGNVVFVKADTSKIEEMARKILFDKEFSNKLKDCEPVYGNGNAAHKIIKHLQSLNKTKTELIAKSITY